MVDWEFFLRSIDLGVVVGCISGGIALIALVRSGPLIKKQIEAMSSAAVLVYYVRSRKNLRAEHTPEYESFVYLVNGGQSVAEDIKLVLPEKWPREIEVQETVPYLAPGQVLCIGRYGSVVHSNENVRYDSTQYDVEVSWADTCTKRRMWIAKLWARVMKLEKRRTKPKQLRLTMLSMEAIRLNAS